MRASLLNCIVLGLLAGVLVGGLASLVFVEDPRGVSAARISLSPTQRPVPTQSESLLLVGDIMLARNVEYEMRTRGYDYPYRNLGTLFASSTYVVGNFEASIPRVHIPTPSMTFRFSVDVPIARTLRGWGVTHVFLANNHAYDSGREGYLYTRFVLEQIGVKTGGHPLSEESSYGRVVTLHDTRIALIPIHAVYREPDLEQLKTTFETYASTTDLQIAYIHWGDEYQLVHNASQETLARTLVAYGADAIVGHHPHVVQDIETYDGVPVFFSLGNFIFDQYWNTDVRSGLALRVLREEDMLFFELIPLWSERSNPTPLIGAARQTFLETLAVRSDAHRAKEIAEGKVFWRDLATAKK